MPAAMSAECKMGAQRLLLHFVFLCVTLASVDALLGEGDETESFIRCAHGVNEQVCRYISGSLESRLTRELLIATAKSLSDSCTFSYILSEACVRSPGRSKWSKRKKAKWTTVPTIQNSHPL